MQNKKNISTLLLLLITLLLIGNSCEIEDVDAYVDCDYCYSYIPDFESFLIKTTLNEENDSVVLEFFKGDVEDGELDYVFTTHSEEHWLDGFEVGVKYSVRATYKYNGEVLIAIDSDRLRVINASEECGPVCYYTNGGSLDVRIKK